MTQQQNSAFYDRQKARGAAGAARFTRLSRFYALLCTCWFVLWRTAGDANGWLALTHAWAFWILITGSIAGFVGLVRRDVLAAVAFLVAGLGATRRFWGGSILPEQQVVPARGEVVDRLTLVSVNLLNTPRPLDDALPVLRRLDADVLLFQEAIRAHVPRLDDALSPSYPHRYWLPFPATNMGLGAMSRLPFAITGLWSNPGLEPFAMRLTLRLAAGPLDVYCVHFVAPTHQVRRLGPTQLLHMRERQIGIVLEAVRTRPHAALLAGDWNQTQAADAYEWAATELVDGWQEIGSGLGASWPRVVNPGKRLALRPMLRLDHVFHTGNQKDLGLRLEELDSVHAYTGSDHCPQFIRLALVSQ